MSTPKIKIVYFAYLKPNEWENIVLEQLWSLRKSDLYDRADSIYISLCCNDIDLKRIKQHIWSKFKKIEIINRFDYNTYEYPGLKAVWDISQDDESIILYFHSKGMTSEKKIGGVKELREFLTKNTILNYQTYITEFSKTKDLDVGCIFPSEFGFSWYNFFWINSTYIKNHLPEPKINKNRYYWERYIGSEFSTKKDIKCFSPFLGYRKLSNKAQLYQLRKKHMG